MGISEVTDSLAIAVSEERGSITAFRNGRVEKIQSKPEIIESLSSHWEEIISLPHANGKSKRWWVLPSEVIMSLVLAFFFCSTVIVSKGELLEKVIAVPVEYTATPQYIALVGDKTMEIKLHLSGPKSDLDAINPLHMSVKIDLSKAVPGKQEFLITRENLQLPKRVGLLEAEPAKLKLSFKALVEQEWPVKLQLLGKLPDGLILKSVEINPKKVKLLSTATGKERETNNVLTTPINLKSITENIRLYCKIIAPPGVQPADKEWPEIAVFIRVKAPR
jgi:YbbR domain-containing protein